MQGGETLLVAPTFFYSTSIPAKKNSSSGDRWVMRDEAGSQQAAGLETLLGEGCLRLYPKSWWNSTVRGRRTGVEAGAVEVGGDGQHAVRVVEGALRAVPVVRVDVHHQHPRLQGLRAGGGGLWVHTVSLSRNSPEPPTVSCCAWGPFETGVMPPPSFAGGQGPGGEPLCQCLVSIDPPG